jgi:hypothetical protein
MTKKISFSLLAILISGCILLSAGLIAITVILVHAQKAYVAPTVIPTATLTVDAQMDQIQQQVSAIRGLQLKTSLKRSLMSTSALKDAVVNEFFKDYTAEDAKHDVEVLSAAGLLKPDFNLTQFYKDLYSEQVAGYYDSKTKEMNVITDEGFGGLARMTYAHEFTHALQDQNYDLENGLKLNDDYCRTETEYCSAATALVEGDATLSEQYWFLKDSTNQDKSQVSDFQATYKSPVFDSAPDYMKQDFMFPYDQGFTFVKALYAKDKWQSIDDAFKHPPVSTEQILHPEKYPNEKPITVKMPDLSKTLGDGWQEVDRNVMGEWYSYLVLSAGIDPKTRLDKATAETATAGWGGDIYTYDENNSNGYYVFAWHSTWDTSKDTDEFFTSSRDYGKLRWGTPTTDTANSSTWNLGTVGTVTIQRTGKDVLWLISNNSASYAVALSALDTIEY